MTTTAFDDQFVSATETILALNVRDECQQVHDLQVRLAAAIQRATDAEAEMAKLPELDPMTRLIVSDPKQLKPKKQEPAVPSVVFMAHNKTSSILFAARKDADQYAASFGPAAGVSVTECAVIAAEEARYRACSHDWVSTGTDGVRCRNCTFFRYYPNTDNKRYE